MAQKPAYGIAVAGFFMGWHSLFALNTANNIVHCVCTIQVDTHRLAMPSSPAKQTKGESSSWRIAAHDAWRQHSRSLLN
jgi:hypothetical protein